VTPGVVVTDIEGTTSPIAFVRDTLFPYARARLPAWVAANARSKLLVGVPAPAADTLLGWMDADRKETALKEIQGLISEAGYADGSLRGALYPEVAGYLRGWAAGGIALAVYSSGSVAAQKLLFGHSVSGDLLTVFHAFFDTRVGAKREAASYRRIAAELRAEPATILFLSDVEAELDAAREAGFLSFQLVRPADGTVASRHHPHGPDFAAVASAFNLPEPA
jgi:enolase-phosphatase E1